MAYYVVQESGLEWDEYANYPGRHRAELTERAALRDTQANLIRHAAGAIGPRHIERTQDETFVPLHGTLTMYLGDPATRHEIPVGAMAHVEAGTAQQMANETDEEILVFAYGAPAERYGADVIDSAVLNRAHQSPLVGQPDTVPRTGRPDRRSRVVGSSAAGICGECGPVWPAPTSLTSQ